MKQYVMQQQSSNFIVKLRQKIYDFCMNVESKRVMISV